MRSSGILLPIFSLPGKYGIGCFSKEAYAFVDFLKKAGQTYWQILPIGPTSYGDSPYQSFSTFAGNPYFIDLENLIEQGLLTKAECDSAQMGDRENDINYGALYNERFRLLRTAFSRVDAATKKKVADFEKKAQWLEDYALFMALKDAHNGASFFTWEDDLRLRKEAAIAEAKKKYEEDIDFYKYLQYEFFRQWKELKAYANAAGIKIIGDIPIYIAEDSADVWCNPSLFQMDEEGRPKAVAGCPPDAFSDKGQMWGNPLYDWPAHKKENYKWWISRMANCVTLYDVIRIDHFRGFDEYYSIPYGREDAVIGQWEKGPGLELFTAMKKELGELNIIAEDLGYITPTVRKLVKDTGFPNMKIMEFAFDGREPKQGGAKTNDYLPFNMGHNCVVYTGTHDNETLYGWLDNVGKASLAEAKRFMDIKFITKKGFVKKMIRLAISSPADYCIIPIQDYLCLGNEARINEPSTLGTNWRWRLVPGQLTDKLADEMLYLANLYGRN